MAEEIGGFFVSLKMLMDEGSFRKGISGIGELTRGLEGLIAKGLAIAGVTYGIKELISAAAAQGQMLITAQQTNMSADALAHWEGVLNHVGGSMNAFNSAASSMNEEFEKMQFGGKAPSDDFFRAIAQLGLSPDKLKGEDQNQRMQEIMSAALSYSGPGGKDYARLLVRQLGGGMSGMESIFDYLQLGPKANNGATFPGLWNQSGKENYMTDSGRAGAENGSAALRDLQTTLNSIWSLFSSDVIKGLAPAFKGLNEWLMDPENKANITAMIQGMADLTAAILKWTGGTVASVINAPNDPKYQSGGEMGWASGSPFFQRATALGKALSDLFISPDSLQSYYTHVRDNKFDFQALGAKLQKQEMDLSIHVDAKGNQKITGDVTTPDGVKHVISTSDQVFQLR
jgi:hypothetical protein